MTTDREIECDRLLEEFVEEAIPMGNLPDSAPVCRESVSEADPSVDIETEAIPVTPPPISGSQRAPSAPAPEGRTP